MTVEESKARALSILKEVHEHKKTPDEALAEFQKIAEMEEQ